MFVSWAKAFNNTLSTQTEFLLLINSKNYSNMFFVITKTYYIEKNWRIFLKKWFPLLSVEISIKFLCKWLEIISNSYRVVK